MNRIHQKRRKRSYPRARSNRRQSLAARCADLEAQLDMALELLRGKDARIANLMAAQGRITRRVVAATLRKVDAL